MSDKRDLGTGTVYFHDGQWEGRIRYRDSGNKLIIKSCYAPTKDECKEKLELMKYELGLIDKNLCSSSKTVVILRAFLSPSSASFLY